MPCSTACRKYGCESSSFSVQDWNPLAGSPKLMHPSAMRLTVRPEPPRRVYCICRPSSDGEGVLRPRPSAGEDLLGDGDGRHRLRPAGGEREGGDRLEQLGLGDALLLCAAEGETPL